MTAPRRGEAEGRARRGYMQRSQRDDWRTPPEVVSVVREALGGRIGLDPCAPRDPGHIIAKGNLAGPEGSPADGLRQTWRGTVFVNPPFSRLKKWAAKCAAEGAIGAEVILLLAARTDTVAWHEHIASATLVCLWRGRIRFVGAKWEAPFPVAFAYWGRRPALFHAAFAPRGMIVTPSRAAGVSGSGTGDRT